MICGVICGDLCLKYMTGGIHYIKFDDMNYLHANDAIKFDFTVHVIQFSKSSFCDHYTQNHEIYFVNFSTFGKSC
jgi:hypothetical protein